MIEDTRGLAALAGMFLHCYFMLAPGKDDVHSLQRTIQDSLSVTG